MELGDGGVARHRFAGVGESGGVIGEEAARNCAGVDVGEQGLVRLAPAAPSRRDDVVETPLRDAHRLGADADPTAVERRHCHAKAGALHAETMIGAHRHAVED
jgi:hypothetical protein